MQQQQQQQPGPDAATTDAWSSRVQPRSFGADHCASRMPKAAAACRARANHRGGRPGNANALPAARSNATSNSVSTPPPRDLTTTPPTPTPTYS
jgi:hypothetical protein